MKIRELREFLEGLGLRNIEVSGQEITASCPFASWEHDRRSDKNPSFGARATENGSSPFNCFACHASGSSMEMLLMKLDDYVEVPEEAWAYVREHEPDQIDPDAIVDSLKAGTEDDEGSAPVWDEEELEPYRGTVPQYFIDRGFSLETAKEFDLGYDEDNERLVIPIRNRQGDLVGMQGRDITGRANCKYYNYWNFPKSEVLFGIHSVPNGDIDELHIVEGPMDALRLYEYGYNAVSILGSSPSRIQVNMATFYDAKIYLMTDGDKQGREVITQFQYYAPDEARILNAQCPDGTDPDDLSYDEVEQLRDGARLIQLSG